MTAASYDLVIVGAGASRNLSVDPNLPMPLMGDWMEDLVRRLQPHYNLAGALGLSPRGSGEQFEEALGQLLAWRRALPDVGRLASLGAPDYGEATGFAEWSRRASHTAEEVMEILFKSLHELFPRKAINRFNAGAAYEAVLGLMKVPADGTAVFATTNYDVAIELGLEAMGHEAPTGERPRTSGGYAIVRPDGLVEGADGHSYPVLHLHGRVGWYQQSDGTVIAADPDLGYSVDRGVPGLLLPDPNKEYSDQPVLSQMWNEFRDAVERARKVLVIGHSLNDKRLVEALRPAAARNILLYGCYGERTSDEIEFEQALVSERLPGAAFFPLSFGSGWLADEGAKRFF